MTTNRTRAGAALCAMGALLIWTVPAGAQAQEVKEKPRMYTYVANWAIPRAKWAEMEKARGTTQKVLEQALSNGTLVGYGDDTALVHRADGTTHDSWWSSMSQASLLNLLEEVQKAGAATGPVFETATKHYDNIFVSRYYNWHSGTLKGAFTHAADYKLRADAPRDALDTLCKTVIVPMFEKLLAAGVVAEYEVDEEAIHTESPSMFYIVYITPTADGLDKVTAALAESLKAAPLASPAFNSMVDFDPHRDYLSRTSGVYK